MKTGRISFRYIAVAAGLAGLAVTGLVESQQPADPLVSAYTATSLGDGRQLPSVVAMVGEDRITSSQFVQAVAIARLTNAEHGIGMSESDLEKAVLDRLERQAALDDRARAEGVTVDDAAVRAFIRQQALTRNAFFADHPDAKAAFQALLAAHHFANGAAYDSDPQTFAAIRDGMLATALVDKHVGKYAPDPERETYIQSVIASEKIEVFITV